METFALTGSVVTLEPMGLEHVDALLDASTAERSTFDYTEVPATRSAMIAHVESALAQLDSGAVVPFVTRRTADGTIVGSTRYLTIRSWFGRGVPDAVEVGGTWIAASAQRTAVNTEAKLLMLTHAFETWEVQRVDLKTDHRNARSRAAIERLGARFDGILRGWQPSWVAGEEGLARDTAMYSIVPSEWPAIKANLAARLP